MELFLCTACGTQFPPCTEPPPNCPICSDERQFVPAAGQSWTVLGEVQRQCRNRLEPVADDLYSIVTRPQFAIGQRAYLVRTPAGNLLWDCVALLDQDTISNIWAHGGIAAIAISHPHYYTTMVEWSRAFGGVPIYLHEADRGWVQRADQAIEFWSGTRKTLFGGLTLIHCGGHFAGGTVLHTESGALLSGDVLQVCPDRRHYGFMYSYPNYVPLGPSAVRYIVNALDPFEFSAAYGAFGNVIASGAKDAVRISADRHIAALSR